MNGTSATSGAAQQDVTAMPVHFGWALVIAITLSLVIASIQIKNDAKKPLQSCIVAESFFYFYFVLLAFGNVVTTIFAATVVTKLSPTVAPFYFLFAAFAGVFAFESILKNMNVTILDKGVLTIQDWVDNAKLAATAASVLRDVERTDLNKRPTGQSIGCGC